METFRKANEENILISICPNFEFRFHRASGGEIGVISFNGDTMTFRGSADESALIFLTHIAGHFSARLDADHEICAKLCEDLETYGEGDPGTYCAKAIREHFNIIKQHI